MAETHTRLKNLIVLVLFFFATGSVYFVWSVCGPLIDAASMENRTLAEKPDFTLATADTFPENYTSYINDYLPFRTPLIRMNSRIEYYLFHASSSDYVSIGKDGWLFYKRVDDGNPIACYRGENLLSPEDLETMAANLTRTKENLAKEGIEFAVFIAPNKERIYFEEMADCYGLPAEEYAAKQIVEYLRENTDITVVYPYAELMEAKNDMPEYLLYHKTDTHWNEYGAYIGTRELLQEFDIQLPDIASDKVQIAESQDTAGDISGMLNLPYMDAGNTFAVQGYADHEYTNDIWDFSTEIRYHSSQGDSRKIFIRRDSFCSAMSEIIGSQFQESVMIHTSIYSNEMIKTEKPDIFIYEMVERGAGALINFVYE